MNTLPVPKVTKPRPNVVIRICIARYVAARVSEAKSTVHDVIYESLWLTAGTATHSCNFAAEYTDPINAHLAGNITEWSKIANHISVWDYT